MQNKVELCGVNTAKLKVLKNEETETSSIVIEPHLVVRESTCKVKK